jgi:hypothetical protein
MNAAAPHLCPNNQRMNPLLSRWIAGGVALALAACLYPAAAATLASRGYSGTQVFSTAGGDKDEGEPNHCGEPGGASSWFFYKAPRTGVMMVDTMGSSFDTVLAVYIGPGTSYATLTNVDCNNDYQGNTWSKVVFNATSNTMYYIAVDGVNGASGTVKLNYQLGDPLAITSQPQSIVRASGSSGMFIVGATGLSPLSYQWMFSGAPINGATQSTLTLPVVQPSYEGAYTVQVRDLNSLLYSTPATLTVCSQVPGTNCVALSQMMVNGTRCLRAVGHAAQGSVLEASEDLLHWTPVLTNNSSSGLFTRDEPMDRPQRYFRVRLAP